MLIVESASTISANMIFRSTQLRLNCATFSLVGAIFTIFLLFYFRSFTISDTWRQYANKISTGVADFDISFCPKHVKPNLILSSMDGAKWQDVIFKFMESLEVALAKEVLQHHRAGKCLPAPVQVKIIVPPSVSENLSPSFEALKLRYPHLDFPGALPDLDEPSVLTRFIGWADLLDDIGSSYEKVLVMDLDIIFQRDPFSIEMPDGADIVFFKEWWGMKLGQQRTHYDWHHGCMNSPGGPDNTAYESEAQFQSYAPLEIICDGTTLGTADAMLLYLQMMASDIQKTKFGCNDQAMHQHIYYSGLLGNSLADAGLGTVVAVENEKSEVGTIGWVPYVRYNHWGEVLSELGEVQAVVHQFKAHPKLVAMVNNKYAWLADPGSAVVPEMPELVEDKKWTAKKQAEIDELFKEKTKSTSEADFVQPFLFRQYTRLQDVTDGNCTRPEDLCSCWFQGCHVDYGPHIV